MPLRRSLCSRFSAIGLKQELVHYLVDDIQKWTVSNGPQWTVTRLKDFKQYYLRQLAGEEYSFSTWTARSKGRIKGPFGTLIHSKVIPPTKVLNALNAASIFVSERVLDAQLKKFKSSVESEALEHEPLRWGVKRPMTLSLPPHWSQLSWSHEKRAPLTTGKTVCESEVERWLLDNGRNLVGFALKHVTQPMLMAAGVLAHHTSLHGFTRNPTNLGGHVAFLQEPGLKLRAVANPYRIWQVLLNPLKVDLFNQLSRLTTDCTYDQTRGVNQVQKWLQEDRMVFSVDLSDATNRAPLSEQMSLLHGRYDMNDRTTRGLVTLFEGVSRESWKLPDNTSIRWTKGQPLGLGPSFASFALWHNLVLDAIRKDVGGDFVVLGDDVCIVGEKLNEEYRRFLNKHAMPVSESKSFSSKLLAEFAGKVITPNKVFTVGKWRAVSDRNFIDLARELGPQSISMFRPRQQKVLRLISVVPEFLGGLGWNSKGLPFEDRLQIAIDLGLLDTKAELVRFTSSSTLSRRTLNNVYYGIGFEGVALVDTRSPVPTRDEFSRLNALLGISDGFAAADFLGGEYRMGSHESDPRGVDQLTSLEQRIRTYRRRIADSVQQEFQDEGPGPEFTM